MVDVILNRYSHPIMFTSWHSFDLVPFNNPFRCVAVNNMRSSTVYRWTGAVSAIGLKYTAMPCMLLATHAVSVVPVPVETLVPVPLPRGCLRRGLSQWLTLVTPQSTQFPELPS